MASFLTSLSSLVVLISALIQVTLNLEAVTPPRVAVPLGGSSTIPCQIDVSYISLYWHRILDEDSQMIVVSRVHGELSGEGLDSGDFNLTEDGTLVINYMRLGYEARYKCTVLDEKFNDADSYTQLVATVKPEVGPSVKLDCDGEGDSECDHQLDVGDLVNLTCRSGEARPPLELTWTNDQGTPIEPIFSEEKRGILTGTTVTISTIQYQFKRTTILTCQADGESVGRGNREQRATIDLLLRGEEVPPVDPGKKDHLSPTPRNHVNPGIPFSDEKKGKGLDLVIILVVVVAVAIGVVFILGIAVAVLYKKNKEYLDAISYSYCLSKDGYNSFFPRSGKSYHRAEPEDYIRGYNDTVSNKL